VEVKAMAGIDLQSATILGVSQLVRSRRLSPVELIQATLDHIVAMNPALQAYTTVSADYALRRARQAENETAEVSLPHACEARGTLTVISEPESAVNYAEVSPEWRLDSLEPDLQEYSERGRRYTMAEHLQAQRGAAVLRQELTRAFKEVDVSVTPPCPTPALPIAESLTTTKVRGRDVSARALAIMFTACASVAGLPALSVPCGFVDGRLPVGFQIMGRRLEEALVLRVGHAYEQATEWHLRHPNEAVLALQGEVPSAPKG
jgi:Asp-tRNA(Asn)/Glu-tRNA(Gln) amidotransferase A subunit family amidase